MLSLVHGTNMCYNSFRRRDFFALFGGATTIWPLGVRAQQAGRVKQIGILAGAAKNELTQSQVRALEFGLQELGWFDGRNLHIEYRWAGGDPDRIHAFAKEIVALAPDLIVGVMTPVVAALKQQTRTIPIVFVGISDPVRSEFVESFS
jgi:putative tryptophan/tyrosine transport system substrate-binding protein